MAAPRFESIPHVAHVERLDGRDADPSAPPALLVEVPHGADQREHYDALRSRMVGTFPDDLHVYFHVNTDIGAYQYGRRVAEQLVQARPNLSALVIRCLIPRTFIDTNRREDATENLASAGLTAGVAPYVRHPDDVKLLLSLHRAYVGLAERAYPLVCDAGGFALSPHTYGPRSMDIAKIDDSIVHELRKAHLPENWDRWPVRPELDFITVAPDGKRYAPSGLVESLTQAYQAAGIHCSDSATYKLHPSAQGSRWAMQYPDRFLCLEVRRDLLVEAYTPFEQMTVRADQAERFARPLSAAIAARLR
ncbi:MAG: hypothetical protein K1X89_21880 [Myxococcaceae bacterium]|nr:hypothetical protein [Myxococcaceae bacterium]